MWGRGDGDVIAETVEFLDGVIPGFDRVGPGEEVDVGIDVASTVGEQMPPALR